MRFYNVIFICLFYSSLGFSQVNSGDVFKNDISLPSKQYILNGVQNDMYIQTFLKRWRPYDNYVRFSGTVKYSRRYEKVASIINSESGQTIKVDLVEGNNFEIQKSIVSTICTGEPGVGDKEVVVQFLGDSYTRGLYFKSAILENNYVPKVKCVGLRQIEGYKGQFHEGRGGWTLENYFSNRTNISTFFNPFYQPQGKYRYWGSTAFWKNVIGLENKTISTSSFEPNYSCGNYDGSKFNAAGKPAKPDKDDIIFDSKRKEYQKWDGKSWAKMNTEELNWTFQYDKYLSMWNLEAPKFLVVMLGLNDFRNQPFPLGFIEWNNRIEILLNSYLSTVPDGKLILCTPSTSCGTLDNKAGDFTVRQNAAMWEHRKNIIDVFDKRESEGIYVVDASISIDNENGYRQSDSEIPLEGLEGYQGNNRLIIQEGNPHPYLSYPSLGIPIAAFIQYYREK